MVALTMPLLIFHANTRWSLECARPRFKRPLSVKSSKASNKHLTEAQWKKVIARLSQRASFIAKLLVGEIPDNVETVFAEFHTHFLPNSYQDFKVSCNCPDYAVPCKHIAGVCYRLANTLDQNPLLQKADNPRLF
jgi:uncharacterized Zn finger protein